MRHHGLRSAAVAIAIAVVTAGCAERQAQVVVQSSLSAVATGLVEADASVAGAIEEAAAITRAAVISEGGDLARYDSLMSRWTEVVDALRALRAALVLAQAAVSIWIESGDLPASFAALCSDVGEGVTALLGLLEAFHVEVPDGVTALSRYTEAACTAASPWLSRR